MAKDSVLHTVRNVLVIVSFLLMIAVVLFQWLEIDKYQIQDHMVNTVKSLFVGGHKTPQRCFSLWFFCCQLPDAAQIRHPAALNQQTEIP